jgi:hypothetical protein
MEHRDSTFDRDRELTPIDEFVERHERPFASSDDHHWSAWSPFLEMCDRFELIVIDHLDPDDKVGNGFVVSLDAAR